MSKVRLGPAELLREIRSLIKRRCTKEIHVLYEERKLQPITLFMFPHGEYQVTKLHCGEVCRFGDSEMIVGLTGEPWHAVSPEIINDLLDIPDMKEHEAILALWAVEFAL